MADKTRSRYKGNDLCSECHEKSNLSHNNKVFKDVGRCYADLHNDLFLTEEERLTKQLARLQDELAKLQAKMEGQS